MVWFGEMVPEMKRAADLTAQADILIIIGTSLVVYPAAGLIDMPPPFIPKIYIDPKGQERDSVKNLRLVKEKAATAVPGIVDELCASA